MAKKRRRGQGEGALYKRSDGMWIGAVSIPTYNGKRIRKTVSSKDRGKAAEKLRQLQQDVADGMLPTSTTTTVEKWLGYWLTEIKQPDVDPKTFEWYEESVRRHIVPAIGTKRVTALTPEQVRGMLGEIETSGNKQRAYLTIRQALKAAITEGMIRRNVTDAVAKPGHLAKVSEAFDAETAQRIILTGFQAGDEWGTRWATAFLTGARPPGEILGMRWKYVDLEAATVELSWQLQQLDQVHGCGDPVDGEYPCGLAKPGWCPDRKWKIPEGFEIEPCYRSLAWTRPKSEAGTRLVPLIPPLHEAFIRLAETAEQNEWDLVFTRYDSRAKARRPIQPRQYQRDWAQLLEDAGVPYLKPYASRHSTATLLQSYGVDEDTRMRIMGQSSAAAHRKYVHVDLKQARAALENLSGLMPINP